MVAMTFIFLVKDFPWLRHSSMKTPVRERNEKIIDILKNMSMLGAAILLMADRSVSGCCAKKEVEVQIKESKLRGEGVKTGKKG